MFNRVKVAVVGRKSHYFVSVLVGYLVNDVHLPVFIQLDLMEQLRFGVCWIVGYVVFFKPLNYVTFSATSGRGFVLYFAMIGSIVHYYK